jgi:hypothetical protein
VIDYHHNASDVLTGAFIGISLALLMFYVHFAGEACGPAGKASVEAVEDGGSTVAAVEEVGEAAAG